MWHRFPWSYCSYWNVFMELTQQDVSPIPRIILFNVRIDNTLMKLTQQDVSTIVIGLRLLELNTYHGLSRCDITDISMISCMSLILFLIFFNKSHAGITDHGRHCFLWFSVEAMPVKPKWVNLLLALVLSLKISKPNCNSSDWEASKVTDDVFQLLSLSPSLL